MGKLTKEQAQKMLETATKNAESNSDKKYYPESKRSTINEMTSELRTLPSKKKMPGAEKKLKTLLFRPSEAPKFEKPKPFNPNEMKGKNFKYAGEKSTGGEITKGKDYIKDLL